MIGEVRTPVVDSDSTVLTGSRVWMPTTDAPGNGPGLVYWDGRMEFIPNGMEFILNVYWNVGSRPEDYDGNYTVIGDVRHYLRLLVGKEGVDTGGVYGVGDVVVYGGGFLWVVLDPEDLAKTVIYSTVYDDFREGIPDVGGLPVIGNVKYYLQQLTYKEFPNV